MRIAGEMASTSNSTSGSTPVRGARHEISGVLFLVSGEGGNNNRNGMPLCKPPALGWILSGARIRPMRSGQGFGLAMGTPAQLSWAGIGWDG